MFEQSLPYVYALGDHSPVPVQYSIRVGEIAYNLRSALDHLVWQLVQSNGQHPDSYNESPIFRYKSRVLDQVERKLKGIDEDRRQLIHEFQPFNLGGGIGKHLLMLNTICNFDKHRHLNVVATHSHVHLGKRPLDPLVDVCFMDKELEENSPGYTHPLNKRGLGDLLSCPPWYPAWRRSTS